MLIGITAYWCTDIIHEVIGHSSAALLAGYHITLLTSVYFKSEPINFVIGLSGPMANLIFGLVLFMFLKYKHIASPLTRYLICTVMAYNFFWFSGTILASAFSQTGDWTYAFARLNTGALDKPLLVFSGILAYIFSIRFVANQLLILKFDFSGLNLKQSVYYAYFLAILAAVTAGLLYAPDRIAASKEGLLEMMASVPVLFIVRKINYDPEQGIKVNSNRLFYLAACIAFILFCMTLGKGIY